MKSTAEFGEYLQRLIDRHREDLSILLEDYGIDEEPTPLLLMAMMKRDKDFVAHLANLPEDRADGNFLNTLSKGLGLINKGKEVADVLKGKDKSTVPPPPPPPTKKGWSTKKIIGVSAAVIAALIITALIIKKVRKK